VQDLRKEVNRLRDVIAALIEQLQFEELRDGTYPDLTAAREALDRPSEK
jgi:hypothetical protein